MARMIDAVQVLHNINLHHRPTPVSEFESGFNNGLNQAMWEITHTPTLTQPNEGGKDKNVPANEPLTLEELKAEAKRQGYKLIKAKRPRFEPCLCGHNVHQWVSGPKGWAVYCKHCGLQGPWAKKSHNAVIVAWNAMILEKRKEQSHEDV